MLKVFVALMSIGILALSPVTQSAMAATPVAKPVVPSSVPPPDPGDTYASVWGISHSCNANTLCQATFSGTAQLTGWAAATLNVYVNLYANGTKLGSNSQVTSDDLLSDSGTYAHCVPGTAQPASITAAADSSR